MRVACPQVPGAWCVGWAPVCGVLCRQGSLRRLRLWEMRVPSRQRSPWAQLRRSLHLLPCPPPPGKTSCVSPARGLPGDVSGPSLHSWASAEGPARFRGLGLCSELLSVLAVLLLLQYWAGVGPVSVLMLALFPLGIGRTCCGLLSVCSRPRESLPHSPPPRPRPRLWLFPLTGSGHSVARSLQPWRPGCSCLRAYVPHPRHAALGPPLIRLSSHTGISITTASGIWGRTASRGCRTWRPCECCRRPESRWARPFPGGSLSEGAPLFLGEGLCPQGDQSPRDLRWTWGFEKKQEE